MSFWRKKQKKLVENPATKLCFISQTNVGLNNKHCYLILFIITDRLHMHFNN
jgi:hypothetical protein